MNSSSDGNEFFGFENGAEIISYLPVNRTLSSIGLGKVILIKLDDPKLLHNPVLLAKEINKSNFNDCEIENVRTNKKKNLIIIEFKNSPDQERLRKLLSIDKIGTYKIQCSIPNSDSNVCGVISPISIDLEVKEISENIQIAEGEKIPVVKVDRLKKKNSNEWVDSHSVKITFQGGALPKAVKIGYCYYRVKPFVDQPLMCYNCQRLGHTATSCRSGPRCLLCGEAHNKNECKKKEEDFKCANCKGCHKANSSACIIYN